MSCLVVAAGGRLGAAPPPQPAVDAGRLEQFTRLLGDDRMEGRAAGSEGERRAVDAIVAELQALQLSPMGDNGGWLQWVPMHGSMPLPGCRLQLHGERDTRVLAQGDQYLLVRSGAQTLVPQPVQLVFAGWGIQAPEFDHDDYATIDARGKIAVVLTGEPPSDDPAYFDGATRTAHATLESKLRTALAHGARGTVLVLNPRDEQGRPFSAWQHEFAFEEVGLAYAVNSHLGVLMHAGAAAGLFEGAPHSLDQVLGMEAEGALPAFPLRTRLSFHGQFVEREFRAPNVVAALPGTDPSVAGEWLLISAHHDHLGIGPAIDGDPIYNGVSDNAMGVACVLELARSLAARAHAGAGPRRSVLLLFLTGEEKGLLGSSWYVQHPAVPLDATIAALNVDGLAMFDTFDDVVGVGTELSTLDEALASAAAKHGLSVSPVPSLFAHSEPFVRSDQVAFARAGIPSLLVMEGLVYRHLSAEQGLTRWLIYGQQIYHTPDDELDQGIDFGVARQHCELLATLALDLADAPTRPRWRSAPARPAVGPGQRLRLAGSDTMLPLTRAWATRFAAEHPEITVEVAGGGSAAGLRRLVAGEVELCALSRPVRPDEARALAIQHERLGMTFLVAKDALSIYVHPQNPVTNLTVAQLRGLFSGEIHRWSEVGGDGRPVVPLIRTPASGTYHYFQQHVLDERPYARTAVTLPTTDAIQLRTLRQRDAVGHGRMVLAPDVRVCALDGVQPSEESVRDNRYPLTRYLYLATTDAPLGITLQFVDWVLGSEGQRIVREAGFVPLWEDPAAAPR